MVNWASNPALGTPHSTFLNVILAFIECLLCARLHVEVYDLLSYLTVHMFHYKQNLWPISKYLHPKWATFLRVCQGKVHAFSTGDSCPVCCFKGQTYHKVDKWVLCSGMACRGQEWVPWPFKTHTGQGKGYLLCSWHCAKPFACIH